MKFDLDKYEPVEERIKKFYAKYPDGRIIPDLMSDDINTVIFKVSIYKDHETEKPMSVGWALEMRETEKKISNKGYEYEDVNYTSWLENCETSAIGRALANMGLHGSKRPSKEEMQKVERMSKGNDLNEGNVYLFTESAYIRDKKERDIQNQVYKDNGFRWNPEFKAWVKEVSSEEAKKTYNTYTFLCGYICNVDGEWKKGYFKEKETKEEQKDLDM